MSKSLLRVVVALGAGALLVATVVVIGANAVRAAGTALHPQAEMAPGVSVTNAALTAPAGTNGASVADTATDSILTSGLQPVQPLTPENGYVFVASASGDTRCQVSAAAVGCETPYLNAPLVDGAPVTGIQLASNGTMRWTQGNLGEIPAQPLAPRAYAAQGWTIDAQAGSTRFTNDTTGHGLDVGTGGVKTF